ncbi:MAG: DUF45 domain-containing protein [Propionibacteriaceae bacterium]|jgi:hypothetical protein|nr:DUF45 domain-containing protein [Propionibacteriaceae bacterium]
MSSEPFTPAQVPQLTGDDCRQLLAEAAAALVSREIEGTVTATASALGRPEWLPCQSRRGPSYQWVAPLDVTFMSEGVQTTARLDWPVPWEREDGSVCLTVTGEEPVRPGRHAGLYIGAPLAVGQGVRLRPGLHVIPRPTPSGGWKLDLVVASRLGMDVYGGADKDSTWERLSWAVLGKLPGRYVDDALRAEMSASLGLEPDTQDRDLIANLLRAISVLPEHRASPKALTFVQESCAGIEPRVVDPLSEPRRTAASRNRLFGGDEAMAELVYARLAKSTTQVSAQTDGLKAWLEDVSSRLSRATEAASAALASGRAGVVSVVGRVDEGMTLTRVEQAARTCFIGFRGVGRIRGRADLRDLEPGWRGALCPVQTPESKDTGLVRYSTVGARDDAPLELSDWFDLSASAALIPFINHDDPARASIGSKNLKQAVPVDGRQPPLVATGWEQVLGSAEGVARAPEAGRVSAIEPGFIMIETNRRSLTVATDAPWQRRSQVDNEWFVDVEVGDQVRAGQILAHAPDVKVLDEAKTKAELCLGVNALVALTPWHGLNYEDGIVVSQSFADRMGSTHIVRIDEPRAAEDSVTWLINPRSKEPVPVEAGEAILLVTRPGGRTDTVRSPVTGQLMEAFLDNTNGFVSALIQVRRPLAVGDKLSNRHQGKGVVSAILPDDQMPRLPENVLGGRAVEVILNPVGVLRRLNIGQLWEMHVGLEALLTDGQPRRVSRVVEAPAALGQALAQLGAPRGRMKLTLPDGRLLGGADGVVVGPQYIMKLNHLAAAKLSVRDGQPSKSPVTAQPSQSRRFQHDHWVGSAQRLGEMEVWALEAAGAQEVLADAFQVRSAPRDWAKGKPRASLRSVQAHLAVGGLKLAVNDTGLRALQDVSASEVRALTPLWREIYYPKLPHWRELGRWDRPASQSDLAALRAAFGAKVGDSNEPVYAGGDPLYRSDEHGRAGSPKSERVLYAIPLPRSMPHPWSTKKGPTLPPLTAVPVLPPAFRVATPIRRGLDRAYQDLAWLLVEYDRVVKAGPKNQLWPLWSRIQDRVKAILGAWPKPEPDSVLARLSGKRGLLSRYLLGQSVTHSGRAVIVPDLNLQPDQVGLPRLLALGLGLNGLDPDDDVVIVNRQPSLHPYNLVALRAKLIDDDAIHLHPLCLGGLAGDFDGDTVAVHRPVTPAARRDAWEKLSPASRIRSSANGGVLAKMDLDIALGLYRASRSGSLPAALASTGLVLDSDHLPQAVSDLVSSTSDPNEALRLLDEVERAGLDAAVGWSIGALDLLADGERGHLAAALAAGVAGGEKAVKQLLRARGGLNEHSGHPNSVVPNVAGCYLTGLSSDDYFNTAPVALAELAHKKLTTPRAGQLTKELVAIADAVVISQTHCETDAPVRSPLTCSSEAGVCQACYGADPGSGAPPQVGSRIGLLAATVIGERSTQDAMKAFQGGGGRGEALGNALDDLYAIFGLGRSVALDLARDDQPGRPLKLSEFLAAQGDLGDPRQRAQALQPLVDLAVAKLGGQVAAVHVQVILKQLVDAFILQRPTPPKGYSDHPTVTLEPTGDTFAVKRSKADRVDPELEPFIASVIALLTKWSPIVLPPESGHRLVAVRLKPMASRWGSHSRKTQRLSLNLKLAGRDPRLLECLIVHELTHFYGQGHGPDWQARMNAHLPGWRLRELELRPGDLATFAQRRERSAFETATTRGDVSTLTDTGEPGVGGLRTKLVVGGLS